MPDEISQLKIENEELKREIEFLKSKLKNRGKIQKKGMEKKASQGKIMSRTPFGYKTEGKLLVPAENFQDIERIFEEFLGSDSSLRKISQKYKLSVNGLKKILKNFTYIGKVKFNNQIYNGNHKPIISSTLFNHVQDKLERLGVK
jgi:site-specific DNA recombinase